MPVTIRDVAKLAGTSVAAVSAVLNEPSRTNIRVGKAARERILAAAAELNYVPNPLARSLVTKHTGALGLLVPYTNTFIQRNPFGTQLMSGILEEVMRRGYNLTLLTAIGDDWQSADPALVVDPRVDGVILVMPPPRSPVVERCRTVRFPYVAVLDDADEPDTYVVNDDSLTGGRIATEHLIGLGHRRIAHLSGNPAIVTSAQREAGYREALRSAGIELDPELVRPGHFSTEPSYREALVLLDLPAERRPTAVFAGNDVSAEGVIRAAHERGLRVPEDLAVVGYDDTWYAEERRPPLTSVNMPIYSMGVRATRMVIDQIEGREIETPHLVLPVWLHVRESCGAAARRS